jgi:hypothetical protein
VLGREHLGDSLLLGGGEPRAGIRAEGVTREASGYAVAADPAVGERDGAGEDEEQDDVPGAGRVMIVKQEREPDKPFQTSWR